MTRLRRACLVVTAVAPLWLVPAARAADPVKDAATRHNYDFTQPDPGEILPNPKQGVGLPPALRDYVTVHKMSDDAGQAAAAAPPPVAAVEGGGPPPAAAGSAPPAGPPPSAAAAKPAPENPPKAAVAPPSAPPTSPTERPASPAVLSVADYVRLSLAEQVAAKGVAGPVAYRPSAAALADPALRATEEAAFGRDAAALAAAWQAWQAAHPPPRPLAAGPSLPPRPIVVEARPGQLVLSGAPASVTGDFPPDPLADPVPSPRPERP